MGQTSNQTMGLGEEGRRNSTDKRTQFFKDGGTADAVEKLNGESI